MRHIKTIIALLAFSILSIAGPLEETRRSNDARTAINVLRVASAVVDTETVTIGTLVFEVDTTATAGITTGNTRLNLSGGGTTAATQTLTVSVQAANTETVTIAGEAYTFQDTLTNVARNVKVGADLATSLSNLAAAINAGTGSGTAYAAATTANASVTATSTATTVVVTAKIPGAGANALGTTETMGNGAWGNTTLLGGVSPTAAEFTTALNTAINASNAVATPARSERISANEVLVTVRGQLLTACTETLAGSNNAWASATLYGGAEKPDNYRATQVVQRACNATEAALQTMHFVFPFAPSAAAVQVRSSAGALKAYDGAVVITGNRVSVNATGSTDPADTDLVVVTASN